MGKSHKKVEEEEEEEVEEEEDSSNSLKQTLTKAFGQSDLYGIFEIDKTATEEVIKKAYRKLALKHHPDRGGDKEKFQALSIAYNILSDAEKRKVFDESGSLDDHDEDANQDFDFWNEYFRRLFPKLTVAKIDEFGAQYVGSEEEKTDILDAYSRFEGDLNAIMEVVMFAEEGEEARICKVIDTAIAEKLLSTLPKYEKTRVDSTANSNKTKKASGKKRKDQGDVCEEEAPKPKKKGDNKSSEMDLVAMIQNKRGAASSSMWGSFAQKYGGGEDDLAEDISDSEFNQIRQKITKDTKKGKKK